MDPRPVWLQPPPRPPAPPWVKYDPLLDAPAPAWVEGMLLDWRMTDPDTRAWTGLVRYSVNGLTYNLWLPGTALRNSPPEDAS